MIDAQRKLTIRPSMTQSAFASRYSNLIILKKIIPNKNQTNLLRTKQTLLTNSLQDLQKFMSFPRCSEMAQPEQQLFPNNIQTTIPKVFPVIPPSFCQLLLSPNQMTLAPTYLAGSSKARRFPWWTTTAPSASSAGPTRRRAPRRRQKAAGRGLGGLGGMKKYRAMAEVVYFGVFLKGFLGMKHQDPAGRFVHLSRVFGGYLAKVVWRFVDFGMFAASESMRGLCWMQALLQLPILVPLGFLEWLWGLWVMWVCGGVLRCLGLWCFEIVFGRVGVQQLAFCSKAFWGRTLSVGVQGGRSMASLVNHTANKNTQSQWLPKSQSKPHEATVWYKIQSGTPQKIAIQTTRGRFKQS